MKTITAFLAIVAIIIGTVAVNPHVTFAKGSSYYRSARSGRYTTKSYANSHRSTTYHSYRR